MAQFALLLPHAPDRYSSATEDEMMAIIKDYVAWTEKLTAEGVYKGGHKLNEAGRTVTAGGAEVHDGPFTEAAEILGGIMVVEARDLDHAVAIAKTNPHLKHNARIEVRPIDDV
ncbi:MAG: YciI family protein [Pseudomonadota bacterium]